MIPSGQPHRFHFEEPAELVNLYLEPAWLEHAADEAVGRGGWYLPTDYHCQDPVLLQLGTALREAYTHASSPPRMLLEGTAAVAAMRLLRRKVTRTFAPVRADKLAPQALRRSLDYIRANLAVDLSLVGIAAAARCSPFHFARAFKAVMGLPPHRYVTRERVEAAKRRLRQSDAPIGQICGECGFLDPSHFARIFRRATGVSPRDYRQRSSV